MPTIEIALPLRRLQLSDADVEEADGVVLELLLFGFVVFNIREARNAMALKAAVQVWD